LKHDTFISFAKKLAETAGRGSGVNITFGGKIAYTNGKRINLPAMPAGTVLTPFQVRVLTGYVDHEACHLRHTDFSIFKKHEKDATFKQIKPLWNQLEDVWIENKQIDTYPGVRPYLDDLARHVDEEAREQIAVMALLGKPPPVGTLIYYHIYKNHRGIDTFLTPKELKDYPEWAEVAQLIDTKLPTAKTSHDCWALAEEIFALLPPEDQDSLKDMFDGHEVRDGTADQILGVVADANAQLEATSPQKPNRLIQQTGSNWFNPETLSYDKVFEPSDQDIASYHLARDSVSAEIRAAKKMLNLYLRAQERRAWSRGLEKGRLDSGRLTQLLVTQDRRVMKERRNTMRTKAAIEVVVDLSGSMDARTTRMAAIITAEALDGIAGVEMEIVGFTTNHDSSTGHDPWGNNQRNKPGVGRTQGMDLLIYKGFGQRYRDARAHLGAMKTSGSTPLGEAYGYGLERLVTRPEEKKLLWIISDGDPYFSMGDSSHSDYVLMARLKAKARRLGVETVGMYIGAEKSRLESFVHKYVSVRNSAELPAALMDMVRGQL